MTFEDGQAVEAEENEVVEVLLKNPGGLNFQDLFNRTKLFCENKDLSRVLHRLLQRATLYTSGDLYINPLAVGDEPQAVIVPPVRKGVLSHSSVSMLARAIADEEQETKTRAVHCVGGGNGKVNLTVADIKKIGDPYPTDPAAPVQIPPASKRVPKKPANGNLRRSAATGAAAMVLWRYRKEDYCLPTSRIVDCIGGASNIYQAMYQLVEQGYVDKSGHGRGVIYKWSWNYNYPFPDMRPGDEDLVKIKPKSERDAADTVALSSKSVKAMVASHPTDLDYTHSEGFVAQSRDAGPIAEALTPIAEALTKEFFDRRTASPSMAMLDTQILMHQKQLDFLLELRQSMLTELQHAA